MRCYICNGKMKKTLKDLDANWKGRHVTFRGLSAWVCQACNEETYEPDDVRLMQGLMKGLVGHPELPEIMNVEEVADLLRVSSQTVYNLVKQGKLPATKIGREWRFSRDAVVGIMNGASTETPGIRIAARLDTGEMSDGDRRVIQRHLSAMKGD